MVGQGAVDDSFVPDVDDLGHLVDQLTTTLPGAEGQRSVITAEVDLTNPALGEAFGDLVGAASGLDVAGIGAYEAEGTDEPIRQWDVFASADGSTRIVYLSLKAPASIFDEAELTQILDTLEVRL